MIIHCNKNTSIYILWKKIKRERRKIMKNKIISILSNAAKFNENIEMEKINRIKNIKKDVVTKADMEKTK